ncbi:MAG: tRNA (5-methylaminomethyl-2-thiouridine)(34)-methyltransferase MnmD [Chitinophagales bacterium]|nr:tRNA (5-methylaminomethyl-2-thiouridine)(34)-methyltransferase MnmD [Chitinophagales bacterium]
MTRLEQTKDLSPTLFSETFQQTYHSIHGAISESNHVFIEHGLSEILKTKSKISIFEMGYGTGLNAVLTWQYAIKNKLDIQYYSIEKFPVEKNVYHEFKTQDDQLNLLLSQLNQSEWGEVHKFNKFQFQKSIDDLISIKFNQVFDLIYFDAFSPNAQPELWTESIFKKIYESMHSDGILVTYCAKGQVKRNLKTAGFLVESPAGPVGKREMTRARKTITNH